MVGILNLPPNGTENFRRGERLKRNFDFRGELIDAASLARRQLLKGWHMPSLFVRQTRVVHTMFFTTESSGYPK